MKHSMTKSLTYNIFVAILLIAQLPSFGQKTNPLKFDLSNGSTFTLSQYSGNNYPKYISVGVNSSLVQGTFNQNLKTDAQYSNSNSPGRWRDEGLKTMSYRGGSDILQQGCFQFRADATGRENIKVEWIVRVISFNTNTNCIELQWKDGNDVGGTWNDVDDDLFVQGTTPDPTSFSVILPPAANDLSDLRIRWIYYEKGTGIRDRLAIDDVVISSSPKPLPVDLSRFDARNENKKAVLTWQTQSELDCKSFNIEKSFSGKDFSQIGEVEGNGTTNIVHEYRFQDPEQLGKIQYYRLKQIDYSGEFSYSPIVSLQGEPSKAISVYPTLAKNELTISIDDKSTEEYSITIIDLNGQIQSSQTIIPGSHKIIIPVNMLAEGNYILNVASQQTQHTFKFVKTK